MAKPGSKEYWDWHNRLAMKMEGFNGEHPDQVDVDIEELYDQGLSAGEALHEIRDRMVRLWTQ